MRSILFLSSIATLLCLSTPAHADYEDGEAAFHRGDRPAAIRAWKGPAKAGDRRAQFGLGRLLLAEGRMGGLELIQKSAAAGYLPAQTEVGKFHLHGMFFPIDRAKCIAMFKKVYEHTEAEKREHPTDAALATFLLGLAHVEGTGVPKDPERAAVLMKEGADWGDPAAIVAFGEFLEKGQGVERDLVEAHKYLVLAWKLEARGAREKTLAVRKQLSESELEASRALVREWMAAKDAGELGWAWTALEERSRGEQAFAAVELMIQDIFTVTKLTAQARSCAPAWLRSRTRLRGRAGRHAERWTLGCAGRSVSYRINFMGGEMGVNMAFTIDPE